MKSKNKLILVGGIHLNHKPTCGETMKNQLFLKRFNELFEKVVPIDTYQWQKHPWCLAKLFFVLLFNPKAKVIISASGASRFLLNFLDVFPINKNVYFWVVGGNMAEAIEAGRFKVDVLKKVKLILVQGKPMVAELNAMGLTNVMYVPNSKPIIFFPSFENKTKSDRFKFVFLSRIHPDKGIKEIYKATEMLDAAGFNGQYLVDFYGSKDATFAGEFDAMVDSKEALNYKGYMDLTTEAGYRQLSTYDMMLFPTYWAGEGFPGVVIDANIAGLPIIATDWNLNSDVIIDGKTGFIIPPKDVSSLFDSMKTAIEHPEECDRMGQIANEYIQQFDYRKVLSESFFEHIFSI